MDPNASFSKKSLLERVVLGTASLGGVWGKIDQEESIDTILYALESGIKRVDTAPAYNQSEQILHKALTQWKGERPFVSTKVGRLFSESANEAVMDFRPPTMHRSLMRSVERLGTIDLLFLHEPEKVPEQDIPKVIDFLIQQKGDNTVSFIGLGGYVPKAFHPFIKSGVFDYVMSYNNLNACCVSGLEKDIPFFKMQNLITYQGSTLHMGLLGSRFKAYIESPPDWISPKVIQNASLAKQMADTLDMDLSTFAHRFAMSMDEIDYLVLGARNLDQLKKSLNDYEQGPIDSSIVLKLINKIR